jgi:hypothetical protein
MIVSEDGAYKLNERQRYSSGVQLAELVKEHASIHDLGRSKSSASRDEQDRAELMRLCKVTDLKVIFTSVLSLILYAK